MATPAAVAIVSSARGGSVTSSAPNATRTINSVKLSRTANAAVVLWLNSCDVIATGNATAPSATRTRIHGRKRALPVTKAITIAATANSPTFTLVMSNAPVAAPMTTRNTVRRSDA